MEANKLSAMFDGFEHMGVYVVDRTSLEVYYENPLAAKYTGKNRIGEPCYRAHGNDAMCSSCPIRRADHVSLVNRTDHNMLFAVRCEEILWDGHEAYFISVVKQGDSSRLTEDEKSANRMSHALQKTVNVYTEINMENMRYRQMALRNTEPYTADVEGDYPAAFEAMCRDIIHPDDVAAVRRVTAPEVLQRIAYESEGTREAFVRYHLKNAAADRVMECRVIFLRDEIPHYAVCLTKDITEAVQVRRQANEFESILNNVSCGVAIYTLKKNGELTVDYLNEGLGRMAECSAAELLQKARQDPTCGMDGESRTAFMEAFHRLAAGAKTTQQTLGMWGLRGRRHWMNMALNANRTDTGDLQVYGTFYDVTANIRAQREFAEKYEIEKRKTKDDATLLAYGVFDLRDGRTIEMERRAPLGVHNTEMTLDDFSAEVCTAIPSVERRAQFAATFNTAALLAQHANGVDEQALEFRRTLPDGKTIWVRSNCRIISDLGENTTLMFYYCNDINAAKNLELMTAFMVGEDYDMLGSVNLAEDCAVLFYGKNSSWRVAGHSQLQTEARYSASLEWFVGHAVVPEERDRFYKGALVRQIRENLAKQDSCEFILHVYDENGALRTKKIRYKRNGNDPENCFFAQYDITDTLAEEQKKQEQLQAALQSAEQANAAKTAFLARMSHDMRTPMNGVLGLANLMRGETDPQELNKDLDQLELSGKYLLQLINDTLDVNKIEAGKLELRLKPVDSEQLFGNIIANASLLAQEKGVELVLDAPPIPHGGWVPVMADTSRLEQVMMNIISNAIKFTAAGGSVALKMENLSITDKEVVDRYTITDSGIGMSKEFLTHIYEPFSQEGRANTDRESGTGLGMSIVRQLVELMHGEISIESEMGKGTKVTVTIRYPVCADADRPAQKPEVALTVLEGKRLLLCEDHPINAQIATRLLAKKGITVTRAENGREGVELFEASKHGAFAMILMDIRMPEMNGLEAARAIRALARPDAKTIPIVAMTANAYEDDVQDCLAAGMNAHIAKPIDPATMYETIAQNL